MDALDRKVLDATSGLLKRWVLDGTVPEDQKTEAVLAITALEYSLARNRLEPAVGERLAMLEGDLAARLRGKLGLAAQAGDGDGQTGAELASAIDDGARGQWLDRAAERQAAQDLRAFLVAWYEPTDPEIREGTLPIYRPFTVEEDPRAKALIITREKLQAYLDRRFPERGMIVTKVDALLGGYSKSTYIVQVEEDGQPGRFVIRQDRPGLPTGSSVVGEFAALKEIHAAGVKVPEPLWAEADTGPFGAGIMATGFRAGTPGRVFPQEPERRRQWTRSTAQLIGSLHNIRPDAPGDVRAFMRETLADFRERHRRVERTPHPGIAFGLAWLEQHLDDLAGRPVCRTHGDLAFHNILMEGDEVAAALDWEFTQFSDPVEDLSYIRPFIVELGFWDEFMAEYTALTGFTYDEKATRWFAVFNGVRIALCNLTILNLVLTSNLTDIPLIVAGAKLLQKFEIQLLDSIAET